MIRTSLTAVACAAALVALAACGGGGGSIPVTPTDQPTQAELDAAEQERLEREEAERLAQEEAERLERERLAREEAEREAAEQERQEREAREQAEREAAERAAARPPFPLPEVECDSFCQSSDGEFIASLHYSLFDRANASADVGRIPVYFGADYFRVGVDQGSAIGGLPIVATRDDIEVRHGTVADGVGQTALRRYLDQARAEGNYVNRPPAVMMADGATHQERGWIKAAIRMVNAALPPEARMSIFDPLLGSDGRADITVSFVRAGTLGGNAAGRTFGNIRRNSAGEITRASHSIRLDRGANVFSDNEAFFGGYRRAVILIAHELMHALGLGHVSPDFDTLMADNSDMYRLRQGAQQPSSLLYPADREALRVLYGGSPTDFGPWGATSTHLHGNGPYAGFGVALRNGYAEPYAYGPWPGAGDLTNNQALSGSATWTGTLLGFSGRSPVAGDAEIDVQLATLTGRADFTALESWDVGMAPGAAGTGTTWLDGDLGYTIAVTGNTFRETGGDDGTLTGIFTGAAHEGAAGTLERSDLTAAFGASR